MRFLAVAFVLLAFPAFCIWLRQRGKNCLWACALIGILPFTVNALQLDAALINWAMWPGYAKGLVLTLLDSLALAILVTHRAPSKPPQLLWWLLAYFGAATTSIFMSSMPIASSFYAFQLIRMIVLFLAVARIALDLQSLRWLAFGLAAGTTFQAVVAIWQKAGGALQAPGTLGHQNLLGMMTYFALLPLLAMLLAGERNKLIMLGVCSALIVIALGASRGTILFSGGGIAVLFVLSLLRRPTTHKWRIFAFALGALALSAPVMVSSLDNRFAVQTDLASGGGAERLAFERAAMAMWTDHPFGVGANMYISVANTQGYSDRAGVNWSYGSRVTNVHNAYLLTAAETGWLGLIAFVMILFVAIINGLRFAFQERRDPRGEIVLGCVAALLAVATHNFYEWVTVTYQAQYMLGMTLAIISGLARERRLRPGGKRRPAHFISDTLPPPQQV